MKCVYCLKDIPEGEETVDHVIAKSWFPTDAKELEKWRAPACRDCNNDKSRDEGELFLRLGLCVDPSSQLYGQIAAKAKRAIDPKAAKNPKDAKLRFNRRQKVAHHYTLDMDHMPERPFDGFTKNFDRGSRMGVRIPSKSLERLVTLWIRGIHYCEIGEPIPEGAVVSAHFVDRASAKEAFSEIEKFATTIEKGTGIKIRIWWVDEDGKKGGLYSFEIWEDFRVHGSIEVN